ncbi:hypothetical protein [Balneola vulgaris]|uniref:hypothetical protein n=1 Tax=Balneola vulgaris TaxID=287535 RepID=UPI000361B6A2|nr:hypothetical protein [Balneola vulgaris]
MSLYTKQVIKEIINSYSVRGKSHFSLSQLRKDYKKQTTREIGYTESLMYLKSFESKLISVKESYDRIFIKRLQKNSEPENLVQKKSFNYRNTHQYWFYQSNVNENIPVQLISLIFNIPTKGRVKRDLDKYEEKIADYFDDIKLSDIKYQYNVNENYILFLQTCLFVIKSEKNSLKVNDSIKSLIKNVDELSTNITGIISRLENQSPIYKTGNKELDKIIRDIMSSEVITIEDYQFICHSAQTKSINLMHVLIAVGFYDLKRNPNFKRVIDEVCEDGVITSLERVYLEGKSNEYGISKTNIDRLIRQGMDKYKIISNLFITNNAKRIFTVYLFGTYLGFSFDSKTLMTNLIFENELDVKNREYVEKILLQSVNDILGEHYNFTLSDFEELNETINSIVEHSKDRNNFSVDYSPEFSELKEIIIEEKYRIGSREADLLAENILFRLLQKYQNNGVN